MTNKGKQIKSFDGTKIYYESDYSKNSNDKAIIFLHGLGGDLTAWNKEREFFKEEGVSTIAIDLRGHGYSDRSDTKDFYKFSNFSNDVLSVMKDAGFNEYSVVGHCFGGMVTLVLEGNNPNTSKNIILVDTGFKPPLLVEPLRKNPILLWILEEIVNNIPNFKLSGHTDFSQFIGTNDIDFRRLTSDILHVSLRSYLLISENLFGYNATDLLNKILIPTLIIEGKLDTIFPPKIARELQKRIKKSEIDFIDGANHILVTSNPLDLSREIERFLIKRKFI